MAANSSAQGFNHHLQFGLASKAILGGIKRELGLAGFAIFAADRAGQTEELPERKLSAAFRWSDIAVLAELRGVLCAATISECRGPAGLT
jgi:hypothetical protein